MRILGVVLASFALAGAAISARASPPASLNAPKEDDSKAILLQYAATDIRQGKPQLAIDEYIDRVIAYYRHTYGSATYKVYCSGSPPEALAYMLMAATAKRPAVALGQTWCDALFIKAYALVDLGHPDEAKPLLEEAVARAQMNAHYLSELGNWYKQNKDWVDALDTFTRALDANSLMPAAVQKAKKGRALRGMGYSLSELGRYDEAEAAYRKALVLDPNDKVSQAELLYIAKKRGKGRPITS